MGRSPNKRQRRLVTQTPVKRGGTMKPSRAFGLRIGLFAAAAAMGMLVAGTSAQAAGPPVTTVAWSPTNTSSGGYDFGTLDAGAGATNSVTFTLTNSGSRATGTLTPIALTNPIGTALSITSDGCSGLSLGPNNSCQVTVKYAPTASGDSDSATLTAIAEHASASLLLSGKSGTPDLTLSPGTLGTNAHYGTGKDVNGTKSYNDDFMLVSAGNPKTQTFTVTNSGTATGTSFPLQLAGLLPNTGFSLSNDQTSGHQLAPGESSTFQLTFTVPSACSTELFATPLVVTSTKDSPYIRVTYSANCGPPITSVTAALGDLTFPGNPLPVSSSVRSLALNGKLTNLSFTPSAPLPAGKLHGFTIQIPFSTTAGTLNCDMSASYQPGTCGVSNNVLTVTQNFSPLVSFLHWGPSPLGNVIGYVYVGSDQPLGAFVTFGPPIVTAVR